MLNKKIERIIKPGNTLFFQNHSYKYPTNSTEIVKNVFVGDSQSSRALDEDIPTTMHELTLQNRNFRDGLPMGSYKNTQKGFLRIVFDIYRTYFRTSESQD